MQVTKQSRLRVRIQNIAFVVLFLTVVGLLAWLGTRYTLEADWTAGGRNTLSAASQAVLATLEQPVRITAFTREATERDFVRRFVARYQRVVADLQLDFVNPDLEPQQARELGITGALELVVRYGKRSENVQTITEQSLTNALQRLARGEQRWVVFIEGHGERRPHGQANHDLGSWTQQLQNKGINVQSINLASSPNIADNTSVLVIAGPQDNLLTGEVALIKDYLERGGNLLWLADPGSQYGLEPLAEYLGIEFLPGVIIDPTTQLLGIRDPRAALVAEYGVHPITENFASLTLFPQAVGIEGTEGGRWSLEPILVSTPDSWSETGAIAGELRMDTGDDIPGPLNIGVSLTREANEGEAPGDSASAGSGTRQRVVVVGDGDFLSNAYLGNAGNLDLGLNIMNWLSRDDDFINIPATTATDLTLSLSPLASAVIGIGFLFVLPLVLLGGGLYIWWRRRKA